MSPVDPELFVLETLLEHVTRMFPSNFSRYKGGNETSRSEQARRIVVGVSGGPFRSSGSLLRRRPRWGSFAWPHPPAEEPVPSVNEAQVSDKSTSAT